MSNSLETIRHSSAHLMAAAAQALYPKARFGVGPVIENGFYYDIDLGRKFTPDELVKIEKKMNELKAADLKFTRQEMTIAEAIKLFKKLGQTYKVELLNDLKKHGTTAASEIYGGGKEKKLTTYNLRLTTVSVYKTGDFIDLCRGPHIKSTKDIPAFKLLSVAGAYWRGSEKNKQLQRIYGTAWLSQKDLDHYLWQLEEAKKRDHRVLGEKLKLFTFAPEVGPGLPLWLPNGTIIRDEIEKRAKEVEKKLGYERVSTPHIAKEDLFKMSGHIPYYKDSMYPPMKLDDGNYYLKAMNCPHTHMIYRSQIHSYKELPVRFAEYGAVYRYELSGALAGLLRARGFTQNDAHIYCRPDQAEEEFLQVMKLHEYWYKEVFGITDFYMRLSLPAKDKTKYPDYPREWAKAVSIIRRAMKKSGLPFTEAKGEAAFYGPKVDFQIKSVIGREETASTNQLDFLAAKRFNLSYIDKDGKPKPVFVIHRTPLGAHERFIAFLIEHYAGAFPCWLSPVQVAILPVSAERHLGFAKKLAAELREQDARVALDQAGDTVGKKIRNAELQKIPYILVVGDKEMSGGKLAVRQRGQKETKEMTTAELAQQIKQR